MTGVIHETTALLVRTSEVLGALLIGLPTGLDRYARWSPTLSPRGVRPARTSHGAHELARNIGKPMVLFDCD